MSAFESVGYHWQQAATEYLLVDPKHFTPLAGSSLLEVLESESPSQTGNI